MDQRTIKLIEEFKTGNNQSFEELVKIYHRSMIALARTYTHDPSEAEDVVSECWIKIYENIHLLRDTTKFAPWLRCIVRNRALFHLRTNSRRNEQIEFSDVFHQQTLLSACARDDISILIERQHAKTLIKSVMIRLRETYSVPLTLFYLEEMSISEISIFMDIPESTVKWRLHQGRLLFKKEAVQLIREMKGT